MSKILPIEKRRKKYRKPAVNHEALEVLHELREYVEHIGQGRIMLVGDTYRKQEVARVYTTESYHPWVFGYQVIPLDPDNGFYTRNIFMKIPGQDIMAIPDDEIDPIYGAIFEAMIGKGQDIPQIEHMAKDAIKVSQNFAVAFLHEGNPNLIVPGNPATKAIRAGGTSSSFLTGGA